MLLDCDHRTPKPADAGHPYIAIPNLRDGRLDLSDVRLISDEDLQSWTRRTKPHPGDVIVTRRGRVGDSAVVPEGLTCAIGQNLVILRADGSQIDQSYLRWVLKSPWYWEQVAKFLNVGAVFDSLNCRDIPKFEVPVPPIPVQRAIASILGALDDRIDLNRRMNETLTDLSHTLFRARFASVDVNLRPVGDVVRVVGGSTPSTKEPAFWKPPEFHWATPKDLSDLKSPVLLDTSRKVSAVGLAQIPSGLLPKGTVLLSSRAPIGYLAIAEVPVAVNQGFIALVCDGPLTNHFVYHWALDNLGSIKARANGTTFLEVSKGNFRPMPIPVPPPQQVAEFTEAVIPLHEQVVANERQISTLAALRDTLLPKLISGQLHIKDAEKAAEASL